MNQQITKLYRSMITDQPDYTLFTFLVILFVITVFPSGAAAQVNTESLRLDRDRDGFFFTTHFTLGLLEGNVRILNLRGNFRVDHHLSNNRAFAHMQYSRGVQDGNLFRHSGFLALRNTHTIGRGVGWEVFAQQQFDEFLRLRDRKLAGTGVRLRLLNLDKRIHNRKAVLYLGAGGMYEYEDINAEIPEENHLIRSTNYVSFLWKIDDRFNLNTVSYFQFALSDLTDFRNLLDTAMDFRLTTAISFTFMVNYRYDNNPPAGVRPFDIELQNGVRLSF